ncbi:hypothetical protein LP417_28885 [Polaromonas sp. P1-6]|nr:hypothetical protein LP417_28885 [Polaromonas sp. P1-6]
MRPLTSGRSTTLRRERKLPTACMSSMSRVTSTLATSTDGGLPPGMPLAAPCLGAPAGDSPDKAFEDASATPSLALGFWYHHAAPEAAAIPATAITV